MKAENGQRLEGSDPRTPFAVLIIACVGINVCIFPAIAAGRGGTVFVFLAAAVLGAQLSHKFV